MTLENQAPEGLPHYVAPNQPYGVMKSFAELYVPESAEIRSVMADEEPAELPVEHQNGLAVVGAKFDIGRGETATLSVEYELPLGDDGYSLTVLPQPLAKDAELSIRLAVNDDQVVRGAGTTEDGVYKEEVPLFTGELRLEVEQDARRGFSKLWKGFTRFWTEPLF
jgi:hypothetical protein